VTADGAPTVATVNLTHDIPAGPKLVSPPEGATVGRNNLVMRWEPVKKTITGKSVNIDPATKTCVAPISWRAPIAFARSSTPSSTPSQRADAGRRRNNDHGESCRTPGVAAEAAPASAQPTIRPAEAPPTAPPGPSVDETAARGETARGSVPGPCLVLSDRALGGEACGSSSREASGVVRDTRIIARCSARPSVRSGRRRPIRGLDGLSSRRRCRSSRSTRQVHPQP
jgi:hypothetical protein